MVQVSVSEQQDLGTRINLAALRSYLARLGRAYAPDDVVSGLRNQKLMVSDALVAEALRALRVGSIGAGVLEPLLRSPGVTDVLVNGSGQVFIERYGELTPIASPFADESAVRALAVRLATSAGRRLDDATPCVDARLADGTRLHAVLAPLAEPGTCISLRVPASGGMPLQAWVANGSMPSELAELLRAMVRAKVAFLVSGGTGSGKTTLLGALLEEVPANQRIVIVEDSRELLPNHPHCVRLEARHANSEGAGVITLTDLVRQALRMRPDRLVLGEVRGAELTDLLIAMNTGHEGGCGTIHANSAVDVPARLEALAALAGMSRDACHAQAASALQVVVSLKRHSSGQRLVEQLGVVVRHSSFIEVVPALTFTSNGTLTPAPGYERLMQLLEPGMEGG
ncbi:MAG: TadA family conjugal transfer-associated ATPase [Propionibacteriaceae bacterium]|jgi:pilus assembly protein CpaF|nr:TadA family conjugal transfer-associated ATPase [Propionibacteriaceae bacterium]